MIKAFRNFMSRRTISSKARNHIMNTFSSYELFQKIRSETESARQAANRPHEVLYFHKVDDPYSHLTIQYIDKLMSAYDILLKPVLVGEENPEALYERSLYDHHCIRDVQRIAPFYDINFSSDSYPDKESVDLANSILCSVDDKDLSLIHI